MDAGSRPSCSTFDPGPCHWPRKTSRVWSKCMGPFLPCGRPRCSSFPTSVCSVVAIEATWAMNRRSLSSLFLCFPPSLSNSASNKEIKPCYFSTRRRSGKYVEWIHNNSSKILIDILKKKTLKYGFTIVLIHNCFDLTQQEFYKPDILYSSVPWN